MSTLSPHHHRHHHHHHKIILSSIAHNRSILVNITDCMVRLRAPVLETHMFNNNAYLHNEENYKMEVFSLNNVHAVDFFFYPFLFIWRILFLTSPANMKYTKAVFSKGPRFVYDRKKEIWLRSFVSCDLCHVIFVYANNNVILHLLKKS